MKKSYNVSAPKKATNLTINSDLLAQAKDLGINISSVLEQCLAQEVTAATSQAWLKANRKAIEAYNQDAEENGTFSDGLRDF